MTKYIEGIGKTGFILEHKITEQLQSKGWNIINNKYYEDDLLDTVREIDIVAYKADASDDIIVYTTLLISCKKNNDNAWVLLTRDIDLDDPNYNWRPLHLWTNDIVTNDVIKANETEERYYDYQNNVTSLDFMGLPKHDVFAFQEMDKSNGKPKNDKNIFNSITTLMKAQAYEMGARDPHKKGKKRVYQFNLISVIDSDLIELHMKGDEIRQANIETQQMITRYIIKRKEQFYRIRFIKAEVFNKYIDDYDNLHEGNRNYFEKIKTDFFKNIMDNYHKIELLKDYFYKSIISDLMSTTKYELDRKDVKNKISLILDNDEGKVLIHVNEDEDVNTTLNTNEDFIKKTRIALNDIYRYTGKFEYTSDDLLPF